MLQLAWPVLVEQLLVMLVGLVDLWLTGNYLEQAHLAAIGMMSYVLWLLPSIFGIVAIGATALTARFVGATDGDSANRVANQAFIAGAALAILVTLAVVLFKSQFVALTQLSAEAAPLAVQYMSVISWIIPAMMIQVVGVASLRGAGDTVSGFLAMAAVNVVNIAVGATLVLGLGPFPNLGWTGLAIGTACGYVTGAVIVLGMFVSGRRGLRLRWSMLRADRSWIYRLLRIGLPGGIDQTAIVCCHLWFLSIINSLGTLPAAAHGLGVRIESLAYLPGAAFQVAAATMAGQFLGAGDWRRASRSVLMALLVGGGLMCGAGALFFFCGRALTAPFLGEQGAPTAAVTVQLLKIVAIAMPPFALSTILTGGLRGAGDTRWPLLFTFTGFLLVRIPLAYYMAWDEVVIPLAGWRLPGLGLGVVGAWYAMLIDCCVRSIMVGWRFAHGGWQRVQV
jgi:putative MATE family efflux protein